MAILFGHRNIYPILSLSLVVAIELIAACQALDFHRPKRTTDPLEEVYKLVRSVVKTLDTDRFMAPDIAAVTNLIQEGKVRERKKGGREREREGGGREEERGLYYVSMYRYGMLFLHIW